MKQTKKNARLQITTDSYLLKHFSWEEPFKHTSISAGFPLFNDLVANSINCQKMLRKPEEH